MLGLFYAALLHALLNGSQSMHRIAALGVFMLLILLGNPMGKVSVIFILASKRRGPWPVSGSGMQRIACAPGSWSAAACSVW